jgi:transcriptional regulator with XRE-family HTH domain
MKSVFWDNVFTRLGRFERSQKWLSEASGVGKTVINSGIARKSSPTVDHAYAIAKVFDVSIEELLDGENGAEYVRQWARKEGRIYSPPDRVADIVSSLNGLNDRDLDIIRGTIGGMKANETAPEITTVAEKKEA